MESEGEVAVEGGDFGGGLVWAIRGVGGGGEGGRRGWKVEGREEEGRRERR